MKRMREVPMLDIDRERMRAEFDDFDNMTPDEFSAAATARVKELRQLVEHLKGASS